MTRTEPGERRVMNFTSNIYQRERERERERLFSNFTSTFPKYFVVIVISVAYKLLTSTVN